MILNSFDCNKPRALSTHDRKCANKMHHSWRSRLLRRRAKKFKQNFPENYSKSTKIAITACKFSKFLRDSMPLDPHKIFLVFQLASTLFGQKNRLEKNVEIMPPPFLKFLATPLLAAQWLKNTAVAKPSRF